MVSVLTAGHVNWDVTLRVDRLPVSDDEATIRSQRCSGGGSAANAAVALAGLGIDAGVLGSVGDDDNGLLVTRELRDAGVALDALSTVPDAATAVKYLLVDDCGEVAVLGNDGVNEAIRPASVDPSHVETASHVHLTSQRPETAARLSQLAADAGVTVSFDPGRRLADRDYAQTLALADVLFVTDREAEALSETAPFVSDDADRIVVVKRGEHGAEVHAPDGSYTHPGFDVDPVDTTGAGDAFAAGFIATSLRCDDHRRALAYANACGALTAAREGAQSAPTAETVDRFLDTRY